VKNKIKTIVFNFLTFSLLLTPIIHAASDAANQQLLLEAARDGDLEDVQKLIEGADMDPNTVNNWGMTLLISAARKGHFEIVKYLLERGDVKPDVQNNEKATALIWASIMGNDKVVKLLLKHGADLDLQDNQGQTALIWATNPSIKKMILDEKRRREIATEIPPFLREEYEVPPEVADIILEMEGAKPSQ